MILGTPVGRESCIAEHK